MNLRKALSILNELRSLPSAEIRIDSSPSGRAMYRELTRPHPRYKIIRNKCWGVGLLPLPETFDAYLTGKEKQAMRTNRARSMKLGYRFATVNGLDHLGEILAVNASLGRRQGIEMSPAYLSENQLRISFERRPAIYAVLNPDGVLRAYVDALVVGEVCFLSRLLGHGDDLDAGVMYLCVSEVVHAMIDQHAATGRPLWVAYDTFFGASPGLRYFKERLGFRPYKVAWRLES